MVFLGRTKRIHFIGIGGIGMSGIAEVLLNLGFQVTGSDLRRSDTTERLVSLGAAVFYEHLGDNVRESDVVVYSSAVNESNPEVIAARDMGIPVIQRTEMLAEIMRLKFAVTVGGSHGKTSTTSLIASIMAHGGLDPTVIVGGKLRAISTNALLGGGRYIVAEADESDGQFVRLPSSIAVITNIDLEHLDYYADLDEIKDAFLAYAGRVPFYGAVVVCVDDENVRSIMPEIPRRTVTYSLGGEADIVGEIIERTDGRTRFRVTRAGVELGEITLGIPGDHHVRNALASVAVGLEMEIAFHAIKTGLETFEGVGRRFEIKGETRGGVMVVDDYGHHPTEVAATVRAAVDGFSRRVFVLFQPHRYSRTLAVAEEFAHCFDGAHKVFLTDIYPAGETPIPGVSADTIIERVRAESSVEIQHTPTFEEMIDAVVAEVKKGDMVITMGAGDINRVGELLLERLGTSAR